MRITQDLIATMYGAENRVHVFVESEKTDGGKYFDLQNIESCLAGYSQSLNDFKNHIDNVSTDIKKWVSNKGQTAKGLEAMSVSVEKMKMAVSELSVQEGQRNTRSSSSELLGLFASIENILESIDNQIVELKNEILEIREDLDHLKNDINTILNSVQSIVVVPDYSNGSVKVSVAPISIIRFEVLPYSAAEKLEFIGIEKIKVDAVETIKRATGESINLPVRRVVFDGKYVNVAVDCTPIISKNASFSARLKLTDDNIVRSSNYFNVVKSSSNLYDLSTASLGKYINGKNGQVDNAFYRLDRYGVSDYIEVRGFDIITNARIGNGVGSISVYDEKKNLIRFYTNNPQYSYVKGDKYIRIAFNDYDLGQANYGDILCPYEPFTNDDILHNDEDLLDFIYNKYGKAAISWIDDDFSYISEDNKARYNWLYDYCVNNSVFCDIAFTPNTYSKDTDEQVIQAKRFQSVGFNILMHPIHRGWYDDPQGRFSRDESVIKNHLLQCKEQFGRFGFPVSTLVYPGNSGDYEATVSICKPYVDLAICWDNGRRTNHNADNNRFKLRRLNIQPSATNRKQDIKAAIKQGVDNGDWVILGGHIWHFEISDVIDETSMTTGNLKEIINYANSLCPIRPVYSVWNERKPMFDYVNN